MAREAAERSGGVDHERELLFQQAPDDDLDQEAGERQALPQNRDIRRGTISESSLRVQRHRALLFGQRRQREDAGMAAESARGRSERYAGIDESRANLFETRRQEYRAKMVRGSHQGRSEGQ